MRPRLLKGSDPLFATTACVDRGGNILRPAGLPLSTRAIRRICTVHDFLDTVVAAFNADLCVAQSGDSDTGPEDDAASTLCDDGGLRGGSEAVAR
ncbi:MAG: hypothetical protein AB7L09_03960 [Nitrospira sp.]